MSLVVPAPGTAASLHPLRAYIDPVIFCDDRVLQTLLQKEARYVPCCKNYFQQVQFEVKPAMRKEVADWMLEVCEEEQAQPEVFCLAMNYLDRFLSVCAIEKSQLQLLGAVCLLVAWKVREHATLPATRLVEYSNFNLTLTDIMEWEVLLLSKLDWDMSAVIAFDFTEHLFQRLQRLPISMDVDVTRGNVETLITMCSAHDTFSVLPPSLVATACVLTTVRPLLDALTSCVSEAESLPPTMDHILDVVEKSTSLEKPCVLEVMDRVDLLMRDLLPASRGLNTPDASPDQTGSSASVVHRRQRGDSAKLATTSEDSEKEEAEASAETATPTKVLDVARKC